MILYIDTETTSNVGINAGAARYMEEARLLLVPYAIDDGPVQCWQPDRFECPTDLALALVKDDVPIVVHNVGFDFHALSKRWGFLTPERFHCTMAQAYLHGLPGSLDLLCDLYKLDADQAKLKEGRELVQFFCVRKNPPAMFPEKWARFIQYAKQDVEATRVLYKKLPKWNLSNVERQVFLSDLKMNLRGVQVDLDLAQSVVEMVDAEKSRLATQTHELTAGEVESATQRDRLLDYIARSHNIPLMDLRAATVEAMLADESTPVELKQLLQVRLDASSTSVAKYKTLLRCVCSDGRLRGLEQYRGASRTGRQAHRMFQPGNLPRPKVPKWQIPGDIVAFKARDADMIPDVMDSAASAVRGCLIPAKGKKLLVGDWSNIEGRIAAWVAGEDWKVKAFEAYDRGEGPDLYVLAYSKAFGVPVSDVDDTGRQMGKVMELFLQYGGGVRAFVTGAATYRLDLNNVTEVVLDGAADDVRLEAASMYVWWTERMKKSNYGLSMDTFVACDILKRLWRRNHPGIVRRWQLLEDAFGRVAFNRSDTNGAVQVSAKNNWARLHLPSGRMLSYPNVRYGKVRKEGEELDDDSDTLLFDGMGPNKRWGPVFTHGGKIFENEVQAIAADVLCLTRVRCEEAHDLPVVFDVHDELVVETTTRTPEDLERVMCQGFYWSKGLPLAAKVEEMMRYRK